MTPLTVFSVLALFCSLTALPHAAFSDSSIPAKVEVFSPQGTVKEIRQVHAQFSSEVIPFGQSQASVQPFEIQCPSKGSAHWVDSKNWVYDFDADLPPGVHCEFKLKEGFKTLSGQRIGDSGHVFAFSTGSPVIVSTAPYEGSSIEEDQAFILNLNGEVESRWIEAHAYFSVDGIQEKVPVKVINGSDRKQILKAEGYNPSPSAIVIQAKRIFPPGSQVYLVWGEEEVKKGYTVRAPFTANFACHKENAEADCVPLESMSLTLSNPVPIAQAKKVRLRAETGLVYRPFLDGQGEEEGDVDNGQDDTEEMISSLKFKGPFPEKTSFKLEIPNPFRDEFNHPLSNQSLFPLIVKTDRFPPLAKFSADFGILETHPGDAMLPVTIRGLEVEGTIHGKVMRLSDENSVPALEKWLSKVGQHQEAVIEPPGAIQELTLSGNWNGKESDVIGIPLSKPGVYVVELESRILGTRLLGANHPIFVSTVALVTQLAVHFKKGRESSLVWVTSLSDAQPVAGAQVAVRDCKGQVLSQGITNASGVLKVGKLPEKIEDCQVPDGFSSYFSGLYITAKKKGDFSFVHTSWNQGIESWRFNLPLEGNQDSLLAHSVLDRSLLRAGETIHMMHFLRRHTLSGISEVSTRTEALPQFVEIKHTGSEEKFLIPLVWGPHQKAETQWTIPLEAKLGEYRIALVSKKGTDSKEWISGQFRVEEFRVPLMKGVIRPESGTNGEIPVDFSVQYLGGAPASSLPVQFRYQQKLDGYSNFPHFEGYSFSNGSVREGRFKETEPLPEFKLHKMSFVLDKTGSGQAVMQFKTDELVKMESLGQVAMELEFQDPNGEVQTTSSSLPLYPAQYLVGLMAESWASNKKAVKYTVAVIDIHGNAISGAKVNVDFLQRKSYSHRKKLIGGFYAYDHQIEVKKLGEACHGVTDAKGLLVCESVPPVSGELILQAHTQDPAGVTNTANTSVFVYHHTNDLWFMQGNDDRIDLIPEKKKYEVGDRAVLQVRSPFREATVLVTVEREGVLDSFVVPLSGKEPVIEVPILKNYSPNVFISALVIRGRVGDDENEVTGKKLMSGMVDLGKPAFKLGIAEIEVGRNSHELKVEVKPNQEVYPVKSQAEVKIHVRTADHLNLPQGTEVIVAVVDEGLLQLSPNESWKLLDAMMGRRPYEVESFTAQMEVIGKRHFGLKAVPHGGGGGNVPTRELFDTLLYWKGRVALDANGDAVVLIPLNDSVTSFQVVAIADSPQGRFGTGAAKIRTVQDLVIYSSLSPIIREKDHYRAEFTIHNSTQNSMKVDLSGKMTPQLTRLAPQELVLNAGESKGVSWNVDVPIGTGAALTGGTQGSNEIHFEINAAAQEPSQAKDRLVFIQKILPIVPVQAIQATLFQGDAKNFPVKRPTDAWIGKGGIQIGIQATLLGGLTGVTEYMKEYSYTCLEQKVSRAVALQDRALWKKTMAALPTYLDSEGLLKYFPGGTDEGSDVLTSYLISLADDAQWKIPDEIRLKMKEGLNKFVSGAKRKRDSNLDIHLDIRKLAGIAALARTGEIQETILSSIQIIPSVWPTSAVIDWLLILKHLKALPDREKRISEAQTLIRSRLDFRGTRLGLSAEKGDLSDFAMSSLMVDTDVNVNRLLLLLLEEPFFSEWNSDLPKIAKGAMQRQSHGHWSTTVGNAWGALAIEKFVKKFEKSPVMGHTTVTLDSKESTLMWLKHPDGEVMKFPWPEGQADLGIVHSGVGSPWVQVQSLAAIPLKEPTFNGYRIHKRFVAIDQKNPRRWTQGDILKVELKMEAQADQTWVVLNDPIPAGTAIIASDAGTELEPLFQERGSDSIRAYYSSVPKGSWKFEYTLRLNQSGTLNLPPTRIEAMYAPDFYGELPNAPIVITHSE